MHGQNHIKQARTVLHQLAPGPHFWYCQSALLTYITNNLHHVLFKFTRKRKFFLAKT